MAPIDGEAPIGLPMEYIVNHVFLPPKLPALNDTTTAVEVALTSLFHDTIRKFIDTLPEEDQDDWISLPDMMSILLDDGNLGNPIRKLTEKLSDMGEGDVLALHITHQNAGLVLRRQSEDFTFETFELSPTSQAVVATAGRLVRSFPGPAIAVSASHVNTRTFRMVLTQCLESLEAETLNDATTKGVGNYRDTASPQFLTEWLPGILRGIGEPRDVPRIHKRTRDDTICAEGSLEPWRRSPRWLLLRVALQTSIASPEGDHTRYKIFMVYFMARVLELAVEDEMPSDLLHVMLAKINRRIHKLDLTIKGDPPAWAHEAQELVTNTMETAHSYLVKRWIAVQRSVDSETKLRLAELKKVRPQKHTLLRLTHLRPYLEYLHNVRLGTRADTIFDPECIKRIDGRDSTLPDLPSLESSPPFSIPLSLLDLELWASESLDTWLEQNKHSRSALIKLARVIKWYMTTSASAYAGSPEGFSVMILTVMLLWTALDKAAVSHHPLLKKFHHGIPADILQSLVLPKRHLMSQLRDVEKYLLRRQENALVGNPSIFGDISSPTSFGAQYFDQSPSHQELKFRIEEDARDARTLKKTELKELKTRFDDLMAKSDKKDCEISSRIGRGRNREPQQVHEPDCEKCSLRKEAQSLRIRCHEWPLPSSDAAAKSVIFELDIPQLIRSWRSTTYRILVDVLNPTPPPQVKRKSFVLTEYEGLKPYLKSGSDRLELASSTKPASQTQHAFLPVSEATKDTVCISNPLKFTMVDSKSQHPTIDYLDKYNIRVRCTFKLPVGPYKALQYAVDDTRHTSNEIISRNASCPDGLIVHEVHAFAALRSGHRLQWLNIARELVCRTLDFKSEEVHLLLLQASCQAGPPALNQVSRDSHIETEEETFGHHLLSALETGLTSVKSNWQGSIAALTFITLAGRLLSMSLHDSVRRRCLNFLQTARDITIKWLRVIVKILHRTSDEKEMAYLTIRALDVALICHCTFDVDARQVRSLLSSEDNVAILIETAITVNERYPVSQDSLTTLTRELLRRFSRTSHSLEPALKASIVADSHGMNRAVRRLWAGYEPGTHWEVLEAPNDRWMKTRSAQSDNVSSVALNFNVLTGALLINGLSLGRLPREYETHPTYQRLFGKKVLEIVPSTRGLDFETRNSVHGFQVHFSMDGEELIVRASQGAELYECIPLHALEHDFPRTLVHEYVHWINRGSMAIEWRPLESKWCPSPDNWHISTPEDPKGSRLVLKNRSLVEPGSAAAQAIHRWLKPLESSPNINIFYNEETSQAEIQLPRMNLDFVLQKYGLESKQFRLMVVDTNQYIGTLHGLQNKLVLKDIQGQSRIVIVPHGIVSHHRAENHVQVSIATGTVDKVAYHQFFVDKDLGQLVDNGSLRSRLFKLYLHALTSHCLPDSLTYRTGTEEALHGLRLASTRSFLSLDAEHVEQIKLFTRLTPARVFYPKKSKFMQTANWENLSPLSHHESFFTEARLMLDQAESLQVFQTGSTSKYKIDRGASELRERAAIRNACFRVHAFGAEDFTSEYDVIYGEARDSIRNSSREREACYTSTMVDKWTCRLNPHTNLFQNMMSWRERIRGPIPNFELKFDKQWLEQPRHFLPQYWCSIQSFLSKSDATKDKPAITIFLANLGHSRWGTTPLVHTLLAFATAPALRNVQPPAYESFDFSRGFEPSKVKLLGMLESAKVLFDESPERQLDRLPNESDHYFTDRCKAAWQAAWKLQVNKCLKVLMCQWPTKDVVCPDTPDIRTYLPRLNTRSIRSLFEDWHKNLEFKKYVEEIQAVLDSLPQQLQIPESYSIPHHPDTYVETRAYIKIDDLLQNTAPELPLPQDELQHLVATSAQPAAESGSSKLKSLLAKLFRSANGHYQKMYVKDLQKSQSAFLANTSTGFERAADFPYSALKEHLEMCKENVELQYKKICSRLVVSNVPVYEAAHQAAMLPRLSPSILLHLLAHFGPVSLGLEWKTALTRFALSIALMQRAQRLVACGERDSDILNELTNGGHKNWDPMIFPEWLLLELENNILIRPEQAQIAHEMIAPQSGSNSIMQLNMGLGKSSVIVPIVAATLADRTKLARVVVLKSLSEQMFQLLVSKLGGLLGRRIFRLPISRSLKPSLEIANLIQKTLMDCMASGGILLVQPESLLSFELLGIDYLLSRELNREDNVEPGRNSAVDASEESMYEIGKVMVQTQQWLYHNVRDILDESDEILSVRFELIYTLGIQQNIEFSPDRWTVIQRVLSVLSETALEVVGEFPQGLEVLQSVGGFSRIRILQGDAGKALLNKTARFICRSGLPSLATWTFSPEEQDVVLEYITNLHITKARARILETKVFATDFTKMSLLLLRGLFAAGVLEFVFAKKRWRVNYGLDLSRSMLAVPYHAKDSPSARSEFSHPDTAITLTCLSYYYGGLNDEQIRASFEELFQSDHAQEDYVLWTQSCEQMPKAFKQLSGVNLRDRQQCSLELFPSIRYSKGLIDYYLQHLVFPKEMKEFSNKLSSSGWEIAREKHHPTTGFSGTNDSKYMLPTPIKQCELPEQLSTNAEVLACLLREENKYDTEYAPEVETLDASALLEIAVKMDPPVRVLLDVGAQLLEENEKIASSWLARVEVETVQAVIFFHNNDIFVLDRDGMKEPLLVSPFAKQMDRCLVYLDEAHTRGTDLKMPPDYRGIVTLGPDLTKDRLAQACMRLRKLGKGQSVVFSAPLEVQSKILECCGKNDPQRIVVEDVLEWAIHNSWDFTKKGMPLWATQGMRHYRRNAVCDYSGEVPRIPVGILEPEALTLDERYGLDKQSLDEGIVCRGRLKVNTDVTRTEVASIRSKCYEFGLTSFGDADLHEEQERELQPESEREQEVEPPPPAQPFEHVVHATIRQLVSTGELTSEEGYEKAFCTFAVTRAHERLNLNDWPENFHVSRDFLWTVSIPNEGQKDSFLRPVNWVLSFKGQDNDPQYMVLSPFEVQEMLPLMRGQNRVCLHVYAPRLSLSNRSLEDLSFCAVPPVPENWAVPEISTVLNLFAGQLYLRDMDEYYTLCRFLGVRFGDKFSGVEVGTDGFISPETRHRQDTEMAENCKFESSPIDFLRLVTTFRRLGQPFTSSHMGKILSGELVRRMDFDAADRFHEVTDAMEVDETPIVIKEELDAMEE